MVQDLVKPGIKVCAQNCSATGAGAFTGETNDVIAQHMATVFACPNVDYEKIVIAYEPVW